MANNCGYEIRVKGKKENLEKFYHYMDYENQNEEEKHFARIFSHEREYYTTTDGNEGMYIYGDCAWSLHTCLMKGQGSYFGSEDENPQLVNAVDVSKELDLEIEMWSEEPGVGFCEHKYIKKGEVIFDECMDLREEQNEETDEWEYPVKPDNFWEFDYL